MSVTARQEFLQGLPRWVAAGDGRSVVFGLRAEFYGEASRDAVL